MRSLAFGIILAGLLPFTALSQNRPIEAFPLQAVKLLESPFRKAQQTDLTYMLALNPDRLLAPYLREAGLTPKAKNYGNWEGTGLDGHIGGHYLSALSNMYAATGDPEVGQRINYFISELNRAQQAHGDGYLGGVPGGKTMWQDVAQGKIEAETFSLNKRWVPLYNVHKIYAGLVDAYRIAGNAQAKDMLVKLSDWTIKLTANLSEARMQQMLRSEHGGMNEVFADVAAITGDPKYLALARKFSDQRILNPLLEKKDALTGLHANTQIPKVIGYKRIAETGGDAAWADAALFFWRNVVQSRTVSIGGNSVREHFHPTNNFSSMVESREGPETCNSYNMLKLTKQLFLSEPSVEFMDYYERTLYNHILSSQHPQGGFVYFTPMRPQHYRVYSQPQEGFWCCVGSGLENHGKYGELIYAHDRENLYVNLFIPSELTWVEKGLSLVQQTNFPFEENTTLELKLKKRVKFALHLRHPAWVKPGTLEVRVNNELVAVQKGAGAYVSILRRWKSGDRVTLHLPMHTQAEQLPDKSPWVSFVHGPIVLAAATDTAGLTGLRADDSRMGHIANGPLYPVETAPVIVATGSDPAAGLQPVSGKPLTFTASDMIFPAKYKNLQLVPFFQIHDARYMLYWPLTDPAGLEKRLADIRKNEAEKLALEARTVDQVAPGEQQPESDHNFQGEKTETGVHQDRHWRTATGWFSYDLKDSRREARTLRVTYFGADRGRSFDILVNNTLLQAVTLNGSGGQKFVEVDYPLPAGITKNAAAKVLRLKFQAHQGSVAGGIFYVRLLK